MHMNLITLFVWLPEKAVWLVMKMLIIQWITEFFPNKGHEGPVIEIKNSEISIAGLCCQLRQRGKMGTRLQMMKLLQIVSSDNYTTSNMNQKWTSLVVAAVEQHLRIIWAVDGSTFAVY